MVVRYLAFCFAGSAVWGASPAHGEYTPPKIIVPEGYVAELAAAPPLVKHPLMAGFDERGRLFIAESAGKNLRRADLEKELPNFIRMLEDTDRDGVFDKSTIFADKMTMPQGALWYRGALYVCSSGGLWRLEDTDDDGVADERKMIVGGFGYTGNAADIHGPFLSPTGRLYWCDGRHGHEFKDADGKIISKGKAARIFSCRPDGSDVQTHCGGGMDNPVELDFMPTGEILGTVNLFYRQRGDCLVHWVRGGVYPRYDQPDCLVEFPSTGEPLTEVHNYGHVAVSGCTRYRSGQHGFGKQYADNFFVTQFNTHKVVRTVLTRHGGTFTAETHDFLSSPSPDFHPTDVLEDADGSLLVIDTGGWFRIGCPTSQIAKPNIQGAIWRIRKKDGHTLKDPRGLSVDWAKQSEQELVVRLSDKRHAVRQQAIDSLARRGDRSVAPLKEILESDKDTAKLDAVWALSHIATPQAKKRLRERLYDLSEDTNTVLASQHALGVLRDVESLQALMHTARAANAATQRGAFSAIGQVGTPDAKVAVSALIVKKPSHAVDRVTHHAYINALIEVDNFDHLKALFPITKNREHLIAMREMTSSRLTRDDVFPLLTSDDAALRREALKTIGSRPHWSREIDTLIRQLATHPAKANDLESLHGAVVAFIEDPNVQTAIGEILTARDTNAVIQYHMLRALGDAPPVDWPQSWQDGVEHCLKHSTDELQLAAIDAVANAQVGSLAPELDAIATNRLASPGARSKAALSLARLELPLSDDAFQMVAGQLNSKSTPHRLEAARAIGGATLNKPELEQMIAIVPRLEAMELSAVVGVFAQSDDAEIGTALVAALAKSPGRNVISAGRRDEIFASYPEEVRGRAGEVLKTTSPNAEQQAKRLEELLANIQPGDAQRGRDVFFGRRSACASCHQIGKDGENVGPDLTTVGSRRDRRDLLEAIALPSASIARGFESYSFVTTQGKKHTGVILRQTPVSLQIRTHDQSMLQLRSADIEEITPFALSVMPEGLDRTLTNAELSDLLAYLQSLKSPS